ncbi:MAG TPA: hypothetical protein VJL88_11610 [Nitrospira sp.]|nr:hypothetical protein [Nitrospira sp.]
MRRRNKRLHHTDMAQTCSSSTAGSLAAFAGAAAEARTDSTRGTPGTETGPV